MIDLDHLPIVQARLEAARAADPALKTAEYDTIIRVVPEKRAILRGTLQGRPAVFRLFLGEDTPSAAREWDEICRAWPQMSTGDLRIAEPLHHAKDHALYAIEDVAGTPLMEHIYQLDPARRPGLMTPPARWLHQYAETSETFAPPRARPWFLRAEEAASRQPHARLKRREARVLRRLRRLLKAANSQEWRFAICHGDFHPNNLILNEQRLTGIDLGGSARMPVVKDIARFLMHMGRRGLHPSGKSRFGVDLEGLEAFSTAFDLSPWEREVHLPFMLGVEALIRVEGPNMSPSRIRRAAAMYDLLIEDLGHL